MVSFLSSTDHRPLQQHLASRHGAERKMPATRCNMALIRLASQISHLIMQAARNAPSTSGSCSSPRCRRPAPCGMPGRRTCESLRSTWDTRGRLCLLRRCLPQTRRRLPPMARPCWLASVRWRWLGPRPAVRKYLRSRRVRLGSCKTLQISVYEYIPDKCMMEMRSIPCLV